MRERSDGLDVAVVGGGLAGLAAGALVARGGGSVAVLERGGGPGGRARTSRPGGFHLNQGPRALFLRGTAAAVLGELGVHPSGGVPRGPGGYAVSGGRLHTLPTGPVSLLSTGLLRLGERLEVGRFLASLPRLDTAPLDATSVDEWLSASGFGLGAAALLRAILRLTTYADATAEQSAGAALAQLRLGAQGGVLYVDDGWQSLVDALVGCLEASGGTLLARARVLEVAPGGEGWRVRLRDGRLLAARSVILAAGPADAAAVVSGRGREVLTRWSAGAPAVRAACLDVALRRLPRPRGRFAVGIDRPEYLSVHSLAARLAPEGGAVIHLMRYGGAGDDPARTEAGLEALLDRLQPGWRAEVAVRRFLPDQVVSHALVTASAGGLGGRPGPSVPGAPGLFVAGDWVGPEGMLADASLASARAASGLALARATKMRAAA